MSKIYIVKSSSGSYNTYSHWNEKAFINKEDAEAYAKELDTCHKYKPSFITDEFEKVLEDCQLSLPEWEPCPFKIDTDRDKHIAWVDAHNERDAKMLCDLMYERGQFMTLEMYDQYDRWYENQWEEWNDCEIEEIELV